MHDFENEYKTQQNNSLLIDTCYTGKIVIPNLGVLFEVGKLNNINHVNCLVHE